MAFRLPLLSPVAWVTFEKVTQQILWLVLFIVLAPILGPRPYGLFSIVMVFVGLCELILLEGAIEALVVVEDLDHLHTTTANLTNAGVALALAVAISAVAPLIAAVFHDEEIKFLIWTLAPLPVLSSLSATPIAVLRRSMQYRQLAIRSILGLLIGGSIGIALALAGAGVWALAIQVLTQRIAEFIIAWIAAPVRMGFRWSHVHFRELSPVGMNVFGGLIMNFAGGQVPRLIIGYMLGPTELGLFTLATRFLEMVIQTTVLPPTGVGRIELRAAKPGSVEFQRTFAKMTQNVSLLSFPLFLGGAAVTPDIFRLWLNENWLPGVVPMQFMLLSGIPLVLFYCIDAAFFAANQSRLYMRTAVAQTATISATVLCTAPFGLDVTCLSLAVRPWVLLPIFLMLLRHSCHLPIFRILLSPLYSLIGATIMGALLTLPILHPAWLNEMSNFILLVSGGVVLYFIFLNVFLRDQFRTLLKGIFTYRS